MGDTGIIYRATNKVNNKSYIGKTSRSLEARKMDHYYSLKRYENDNIYFYNALNKYGFDSFKWDILAEVKYENLDKIESYLIWKYDTLNNGYNSTTGGDGIINPTKETIEKIQKSMLGKIVPNERRKRISKNLKKYHKGQSITRMGNRKLCSPRYKCELKRKQKDFDTRGREYKITERSGKSYIIHNLAKYCRENNYDGNQFRGILQGRKNKWYMDITISYEK